MSAIPIVLCGRNPPLAQAVRQNLMPEYDVIHIISSPTVGTSDLPLLLASPLTVPPNSQSNLGSQNYSKRPAAVVVGGGFDDQMFKQMKDACKETMDIPWGKADLSMSGEMPNYNNVDAFGKAVARRVKTRLLEVNIGGRNGVQNGEFRY